MMTVSIIEDRGNAYFSFSISTSIMEIIDKVKGNCIEKVVPSPYFDSIDILPPNDSIVFFTTSKPTPRPEISETRSEEHTSELQSRFDLVCRLLLENKNNSKQRGQN